MSQARLTAAATAMPLNMLSSSSAFVVLPKTSELPRAAFTWGLMVSASQPERMLVWSLMGPASLEPGKSTMAMARSVTLVTNVEPKPLVMAVVVAVVTWEAMSVMVLMDSQLLLSSGGSMKKALLEASKVSHPAQLQSFQSTIAAQFPSDVRNPLYQNQCARQAQPQRIESVLEPSGEQITTTFQASAQRPLRQVEKASEKLESPSWLVGSEGLVSAVWKCQLMQSQMMVMLSGSSVPTACQFFPCAPPASAASNTTSAIILLFIPPNTITIFQLSNLSSFLLSKGIAATPLLPSFLRPPSLLYSFYFRGCGFSVKMLNVYWRFKSAGDQSFPRQSNFGMGDALASTAAPQKTTYILI